MEYKLQARWTDDAQGKKDYDGDIVSVSTRYWPSRDYRQIGGNLTKPSAQCSILIRFGEGESKPLIVKEFEARTFEEIKDQVEAWAQLQMNRVTELLLAGFSS